MKLKTLLQEFISLAKVDSYDQIKDITDIIDVTGGVTLSYNSKQMRPSFNATFGRVDGNFDIDGNGLETLRGCPKYVGESFFCSNNKLTSFEFAPKYIGKDFYCTENQGVSISLVGIHKYFQHIGGGVMYLGVTSISEGGLGLLWIDGLSKLHYNDRKVAPYIPAAKIINKYLELANGKDAWKYIEECRDELEAAGLHEFAKE